MSHQEPKLSLRGSLLSHATQDSPTSSSQLPPASLLEPQPAGYPPTPSDTPEYRSGAHLLSHRQHDPPTAAETLDPSDEDLEFERRVLERRMWRLDDEELEKDRLQIDRWMQMPDVLPVQSIIDWYLGDDEMSKDDVKMMTRRRERRRNGTARRRVNRRNGSNNLRHHLTRIPPIPYEKPLLSDAEMAEYREFLDFFE